MKVGARLVLVLLGILVLLLLTARARSSAPTAASGVATGSCRAQESSLGVTVKVPEPTGVSAASAE